MRRSLARLAALEAETVLYCHAPVTMGPQLLRHNVAYFDVLEARCHAALARGVPPQPGEDEDVIELVNCPWEEAAPTEGIWERAHEYYRTQGHAAQIRTMRRVLSDEA